MNDLNGCIVIGPNGLKYRLVSEQAEDAPSSLANATVSSPFDYSQPLGPQIKRVRELLGLSQRKFAEVAEVSFVAICRSERETTKPRRSTLKAIEAAISKVKALSNDNSEIP